jgi:large subunit ribosomal protein L18
VEETLKMAPYGSRYRVPLRRRREKKTDYQARKGFVVSGKPRLVARSSLKNTVAQIIVAKPHGDEVLASAHTRELVNKYGWKAATGNVPAAYLTGLLCGLKAKKNGVTEAILDLGLVSPTKGSKVFATMGGVVDAGVEIPHAEEKIVKERTRGEHIQEYGESLEGSEEYAPKFSTYVAKGLSLDKFGDHFVEVRNSVLTAFGAPIPQAEAKAAKAKKPEAKPAKAAKAEAEPKPKAAKPKPEAKAEGKKAAPAKSKAEKVEAEPEAKPKRERKKPEAKEAGEKPAKKAGGKKE